MIVPEPGEATIPDLLRLRAREAPDRPFLSSDDEGPLTYAETLAAVERFAGALQALGIKPGMPVAWLAPNERATVVAWLGILAAGGIEIPLNGHHKPAMQAQALEHFAPAALLVHPELADALRGAPLPGIVATLTDLDAGPFSAPALTPDDLASIMPTSGTTGVSKGVTCSHRHLRRFSLTQANGLGVRPDDTHYNCSPQFHSSGQVAGVLVTMTAGAHIVVGRRFSRSGFWAAIGRHQATTSLALGGMLSLLESLEPSAQEREHALRLIHAVPAPADQAKRLERRWGLRIRGNYGSTEAGIVASQRPDAPLDGSTGTLEPHVDVRIRDEAGRDLPPGVLGTITIRHHHPGERFAGYWRDPESTAAVIRDGWFNTGDRGMLDADDQLYFADRAQDVIRRRGEHVSALELEAALLRHPAVGEAAAIGVPSDLGESDILVFLVARDGQRIDEAALLRFCIDELAYFMVPRYFEVVDALPQTSTGKVTKTALRDRGLGANTWDRERAGLDVSSAGLVERVTR